MASVGVPLGTQIPVRTRLVLASFLMLFLELALIRWSGANIVHLGYFTNFVLLGSFLGFGIGFLRSRADRPLPWYSPVATALFVLLVTVSPVSVQPTGDDVVFWTSLGVEGPPAWITLPLVFAFAAVICAGPAELAAACFRELPRLDAYRYDLIGSLLGTLGFTALAFLRAPSVVWGVIVAVMFVVLMARPVKVVVPVAASMVVLVALLTIESLGAGISWSPYYKVKTDLVGTDTRISVNGIPHQAITTAERRESAERQYTLPYERAQLPPNPRVLIVGAGSGNDVAISLRRGAASVDAVEIDPRIQQIGEQVHPDRPYDDERVTVHVDDGRSFLERTDDEYDLVLFALPDSLTLVSGASSLRLESYLFTREAMEAARDRLAPGGAFAMYNFYREDWIVDRLARTLGEAFDHVPCVDVVGGANQAVLVAGLTPADQTCTTNGDDAVIARIANSPDATVDDWPFLYVKERGIPAFYLGVLLIILIGSVGAVRVVGGPIKPMRPYADLFCLGAAFLLLETRAVTGFALYFGTTWVVNAIVFAGVLVAVLLAVEFTRRFPTPRLPVMYALLAASLALAWLVPVQWILGLPLELRLVVSVALAFTPIFCANIVFAKRFADTANATAAFGANLLGAVLGGCLEYLSLIVGHRGLLLIAASLYLFAFAFMPTKDRESDGAPAPAGAANS
jgi:SAM-dependent methyltransferase